MDLEKLKAPITEESPCGEDLYDLGDMGFFALEGLVPMPDGLKEEEETEWGDISKKSLALLERSKDIRLMLHLARAQLSLRGFRGFSDVINLLIKTTMEYWDDIYPRLDPDDRDPIERVNALKILGHSFAVLNVLKQQPIVESQAFGRFSFRDCEIADGNIIVQNEEDNVDASRLHAAFMDADKEDLLQQIERLDQFIKSLDKFDKYLLDTIPGDAPTEIKELIKVLNGIIKTINLHVENRDDWPVGNVEVSSDSDVANIANIAEGTPSSYAAATINKGINSRDDVIRSIDEICKYYQKNEPSSPVPLFLQRAQRLVNKDFMEIIKDMAEDAVSEISNITGFTEEEED